MISGLQGGVKDYLCEVMARHGCEGGFAYYQSYFQ